MPFVIFILVVGFFFWAIFQFFSVLLSSVRTETTAAQLEIRKGRAEFQLSSENSAWTPAFAGQTFVEGDRLQTAKNSIISLKFFEGSTLFLNENTQVNIETLEKNSAEKRTALLHLVKGSVWGHVSPNLSDNKALTYEITTDKLRLKVKGTIFNLETGENEDILRLMKGSVTVDVLDEAKETISTINMGVGQQLVLNAETLQQIANNQDVLTLIDNEFLISKWHTENLSIFDSAAAEKLVEQIAPTTNNETTETGEVIEIDEANLIDSIEILEPIEGASIPANVDLVKIVGTAPAEASQIQVNGYTLSKYQPGDRKWSYFAATKFGTLKSGANQYSIQAFSRDGRQSIPTILNINYEGVTPTFQAATPATPSTTPTENTNATNLNPPVVTSPLIFSEDPSAVYETSAAVVTISGTVDAGTQSVEVNNFKLRKFKPGNTNFSYIANANYGNLKTGENTFRIVAIDAGGNRSEQAINIVYTPIEVE